MQSQKLQGISSLKDALGNKRNDVANIQKANTDVGLQQAVSNASASQLKPQTNQLIGQVSAQNASNQVQQAQTATQQTGQLAQAGLQQQGQQNQLSNQKAQREIQSKLFQGQQALSKIDEAAKQNIFDERMQILNQKSTNKFVNERVLADYAILQGKTEQDFLEYQQISTQANARKEQLLQAAYNTIAFELEKKSKLKNNKLDQQTKERLIKLKQQQERAAAAKRRKSGILGSIFTGLGTVVGAIYGGPTGASVGSSVGSTIGGIFSS